MWGDTMNTGIKYNIKLLFYDRTVEERVFGDLSDAINPSHLELHLEQTKKKI